MEGGYTICSSVCVVSMGVHNNSMFQFFFLSKFIALFGGQESPLPLPCHCALLVNSVFTYRLLSYQMNGKVFIYLSLTTYTWNFPVVFIIINLVSVQWFSSDTLKYLASKGRLCTAPLLLPCSKQKGSQCWYLTGLTIDKSVPARQTTTHEQGTFTAVLTCISIRIGDVDQVYFHVVTGYLHILL